MNTLNSSTLKWFVLSVLVLWPNGIDVNALRVDGKWRWINGGNVGYDCCSRFIAISFWMFLDIESNGS